MVNPYQTYKQQSVMTMTPADMLTMLYDGLIKDLNLAKVAFEARDIVGINTNLQKSQKIVDYLKNSLDFRYEISNNLFALYDYFNYVILQSNVQKSPDNLDEIIEMVYELRDAYIQAAKSTKAAEAAR